MKRGLMLGSAMHLIVKPKALILATIALALAASLAGTHQAAWADVDSGALVIDSSTDIAAAETPKDPVKPSVTYRVNTSNSGWSKWASDNSIAGKVSKHERVKSFQISMDNGSYTGKLQFRVRTGNGKWKSWKESGKSSTSYNNVEAIQIRLKGEIAEEYDVVYRVYIQDIGWQRRMRNGETAGTTSRGLKIEALRVKLISKSKASGWIADDNGSWSYYRSGTPLSGSWLVSKESPIDEALTGLQRYWLDSNGTLAVSRFVDPTSTEDSAAGYAAYASPSGYIARGKFSTGTELLLSNPTNGKLYTRTRWLKTKIFDGKTRRYRLQSQGFYASVQTGFFKVNGKKYYGWEDGRGYVMRSKTWWIDGNWYKANSAGVLKKANNKTTQHIERYVKWALKIAKDNSHGYSQYNRWGPDYDCSSLVCSSLKAAGFPDSGATWTGNMKSCLKKIGFKWHSGTSGLRRGDILLVHASYRQHTEIYIGNNKLVGAHISEHGTIYGTAGDQTGKEISVGKYYDAPWQGYLRYKG